MMNIGVPALVKAALPSPMRSATRFPEPKPAAIVTRKTKTRVSFSLFAESTGAGMRFAG